MEAILTAATATAAYALSAFPIDSASDIGAAMVIIALAHVGAIWFRGMMRKR